MSHYTHWWYQYSKNFIVVPSLIVYLIVKSPFFKQNNNMHIKDPTFIIIHLIEFKIICAFLDLTL